MLDIRKPAGGASPPPQALSKRPDPPKQAPRFGQFGSAPDGHHARATALRTRRQPAASEPTAAPPACAGRLIPRCYALS
jgi:hypothetical protein